MKERYGIIKGLVRRVFIIVNLGPFELRRILKPLIDNPPIKMRI